MLNEQRSLNQSVDRLIYDTNSLASDEILPFTGMVGSRRSEMITVGTNVKN